MNENSIEQDELELPSLLGSYRITPEQTSQYAADGHILLPGILDTGEISEYRRAIHAHLNQRIRGAKPLAERDEYGKMFLQITMLWADDPAIRHFSLARRFGQVAADLMGVDAVRIYTDQILFKDCGGRNTPWHQDQFYIPLETNNIMSLWMPLVDASTEMGTMSFASGSHRQGALNDPTISDVSDDYYRRMIDDKQWPVYTGRPMAAGDATVHSGWTLHSAPANTTDVTREVVVLVFYEDGARVLPNADAKQTQLAAWHTGRMKPGEIANSCFNPVVYRR